MNSQAVGLTADEFKARLCENLKSHGFIDLLKSQIRTKLISELNRDGGRGLFSGKDKKGYSVVRKAVDSLVAHHLISSDYDYTLSIFIPESGLDQKNLLSVKDILHVLHISPDVTDECHSGIKLYEGPLNEIIKRLLSKNHHSLHAGTQTDKHYLSMEVKLAQVESFYQRLEGPSRSREHAVDAYAMDGLKKAMEERMRVEMELKMSKFKRKELSALKREERNKMKEDMEKYKQEVDRIYQERLQSIMRREENLNVSSKEKQISLDKESFRHRQMMLEDINRLKEREDLIKRKEDDITNDKKMMEEKFASFEEMMKKREEEVEEARKNIEGRVWSEVQRYKLEVEKDYHEKIIMVKNRESKLSGTEDRIETLSREVEQLRRQVDERDAALSRTENEIKVLKLNLDGQETIHARHQAALNELMKSTDELDVVKKELLETRGHLARVLREGTLEKQELSEKLSRLTNEGESEMKNLKDQNKNLHDNLALLQDMNDNMTSSYRSQLDWEVSKNNDLQMKLSSLVSRQQSLYNEFVMRKTSNKRVNHKKTSKQEIEDDSMVSSSSSSTPGNDVIKDAKRRLEKLNLESKKLDSSVQRVLFSGSKFMPLPAHRDTASKEYFATNQTNHTQPTKSESKVPCSSLIINQIKGHVGPLHRDTNRLFFNNDKQIFPAANSDLLRHDPAISMTSLRERISREVEKNANLFPRHVALSTNHKSDSHRMFANHDIRDLEFGSSRGSSEYVRFDGEGTIRDILNTETLKKDQHQLLDHKGDKSIINMSRFGLATDRQINNRSILLPNFNNSSTQDDSSVPNVATTLDKEDNAIHVEEKHDASRLELPTSIPSKFIDLPKLGRHDHQSNINNDNSVPEIEKDKDQSTSADGKNEAIKEVITSRVNDDARQVASESDITSKSRSFSKDEEEVSMDGRVEAKDGNKDTEMNRYMDMMRSSVNDKKKSKSGDSTTESDSSSEDPSSSFESSTSESNSGKGMVNLEKVVAPPVGDDDGYADGW